MTHLLNYKAQFANDVAALIKRQTMRPPRKRPIRAGDTLRHYTGLRTKKARLLGETKCKSVTRIEVHRSFALDKSLKVQANLHAIAKADGFDSWAALWAFFDAQYPPGNRNRTPDGGIVLDLIKW